MEKYTPYCSFALVVYDDDEQKAYFQGFLCSADYLNPDFFRCLSSAMEALSKKVRNLTKTAHWNHFKGGSEARIRCSWVWKIAVETGVACHFEFYFDVQASWGKWGQSWWTRAEVQVRWLCWNRSLSHPCLLQPPKMCVTGSRSSRNTGWRSHLVFCSQSLACRLSSSIPNLCNLKRGSNLTDGCAREWRICL